MRVLGICGSLRSGSYNRLLLQAAARELPAGLEFEPYEPLAEIPLYDQDAEEPAPPAVDRLRRAIERADAVLIATPEYNSSVPGVLKNALDWASRPFPDNCARGLRRRGSPAAAGARGRAHGHRPCLDRAAGTRRPRDADRQALAGADLRGERPGARKWLALRARGEEPAALAEAA